MAAKDQAPSIDAEHNVQTPDNESKSSPKPPKVTVSESGREILPDEINQGIDEITGFELTFRFRSNWLDISGTVKKPIAVASKKQVILGGIIVFLWIVYIVHLIEQIHVMAAFLHSGVGVILHGG